MEIDLKKSEIRCECGALVFDGLTHKSFLVETIDDDIMKQIEEGQRDDAEIRDFEELVEELGIGG